jgi:23S rRNA (pseudouridine1915-N3)-methyltransferase
VNIELIVVGKTDSREVDSLVETYSRRIAHYVRFGVTYLPDVRNTKSLSEQQQKTLEGEAILRQISEGDRLVLLDERGAEYRSVEFADRVQRWMNSGVRRVVFVIGGPYGFSEAVYARANESISLSKMTFSHQIVRAIFAEQLYRAFSIIRHEPYHHE